MTKGQNKQLKRRQARKALKQSDIKQISGRKLAKVRFGDGAGRLLITRGTAEP